MRLVLTRITSSFGRHFRPADLTLPVDSILHRRACEEGEVQAGAKASPYDACGGMVIDQIASITGPRCISMSGDARLPHPVTAATTVIRGTVPADGSERTRRR